MKTLIIKLLGWHRPINKDLATIQPMGIKKTIVPLHFQTNFPKWDEPKNEIEYV